MLGGFKHAARVLVELQRGVDERRESIRNGELERFIAARSAAQALADAEG